MTHALPGQGGYHHVNCQPASYWVQRIEALGYTLRRDMTEAGKARITAAGMSTYFVSSGLIFERV